MHHPTISSQLDECTLKPYGEELLHQCELFDCGDGDLNDFSPMIP